MLMVSRVLVLALATRFWRYCYRSCPDLCVERRPSVPSETLKLSGSATAANIGTAVTSFRSAVRLGRSLTIDLSETQYIDGRFFGLLLMVRKMTVASGGSLRFVGASASVRRMFRLHDLDFLLTEGDVHA
jgi:N-acetylglucosaminyldiphosphoundecaprenol N-acetyl-beta-D-mannosaminyltransferase